MAIRNAPCGWVPDFTGCRTGPCCPDVAANPVEKALAAQIASEILWALTGRRFGCCSIKVRPCKPETCDPINLNDIVYDSRLASRGSGNLGVLSYFPTLVDGQVFNIACGCPMGCCKCRPGCSFRLPGPVCDITEVKVDGSVLAPMDYKIYDNATLVFLNDTCPPCQNYDLDDAEVGTWSVTYTLGVPVPASLNYAAGLLACELAKSMIGDKSCALPDRVQAVARQGVDIAFFDPIAFANEGLTGLPVVDTIIRALNPNRLKSASTVWSPDLPAVRREG